MDNGSDPTMPNYCALYISIVQDKTIKRALMDMRLIGEAEPGRKRRKTPATAARDAEIVRRYWEGEKAQDIAAAVHAGQQTVYRTLRAAGVPMRGRKEKKQS